MGVDGGRWGSIGVLGSFPNTPGLGAGNAERHLVRGSDSSNPTKIPPRGIPWIGKPDPIRRIRRSALMNRQPPFTVAAPHLWQWRVRKGTGMASSIGRSLATTSPSPIRGKR